ncbi:MAG: hypothetical protein Q8K68_09025, partial [Nitrospirota bacterium]|nr:hypothetical protein [Nitrospirota bacterium]
TESIGDSGTILWRILVANNAVSIIAEPRGGSGIAAATAERVCPEDAGRNAADSLGLTLSREGESLILTVPVHASCSEPET